MLHPRRPLAYPRTWMRAAILVVRIILLFGLVPSIYLQGLVVPVQAASSMTDGCTPVAWGGNVYGESDVPADLTDAIFVATNGNEGHSLAVKSDGTVVGWGKNSQGVLSIPTDLTDVVAVATGYWATLALKSDGSLVAWGTSIPASLTDVISIAAGAIHNVALKTDGTVVAWGSNSFGQTNVPANLTDVVAIAAGTVNTVALRADGTVVAWGLNTDGNTNVPAALTGVVAIAAGGQHTLALKSDGTVVAWGWNGYGQTNVPANLTDVVAIAAGAAHSVALKSDGTIVAWGWNDYGQLDVLAGLSNVTAIISGSNAVNTIALADCGSSPLAIHTGSALSDGVVGQPYSVQLQATGGAPPYTWAVSAGTLPLGLELDFNTGALSGTPTAAANWQFTVLVVDAENHTATKVFDLSVQPTAPPSGLTIVTDSALPGGIVGTFYTVVLEATGGLEPYTWSVIGVLPPGLELDQNTGEIRGVPTTAGTFSFTVQVTDSSGNTAGKPFAITPPPSSGSSGSPYTGPIVVAPPTDPDTPSSGCTNYAVVSGTLPDGLTLDPATGVITGSPSVPGIYNFVVQCTTGTNQIATKAFSITITGSNQPPTAIPGDDYSVLEGGTRVLSGQGTDADGDSLSFVWDLTNDGIFETPGQSPTFSAVGRDGPSSQAVVLRVCDTHDACTSATTEVLIQNVSPSATFHGDGPVSEGASFSLTLTDPTDPSDADIAAGFTYAFNCGDNNGYSDFGTANRATCPTTDNGTRLVAGKIRDKDGDVNEYTAEVLVENVPPAVGPITVSPADLVEVGTTIYAAAGFSDPGTADTHTCTLYWGDAPEGVDGVVANGQCSGSHTYPSAGVYTIDMEVVDDDGGIGSATYQFAVVYDPSGGFVTGGGWITSPSGAFLADPTLTGKANFGFVSKYKKGANVPTGQTEFQFKLADLNFHSGVQEWLVVNQAGTNAHYKGSGTINMQNHASGVPYKFMIWAGDGTPDIFRIRIWWEDAQAEEHLVYDNGTNQALGGGSIVIHKGAKAASLESQKLFVPLIGN